MCDAFAVSKQDTEGDLSESIIADQENEMFEAAAEAAEHPEADKMFDDKNSGGVENEQEGDSKDHKTRNESDLEEDSDSGIVRRTSSDMDEDKTEYFIPGSIIHFLKKPAGSDRKSVAIRYLYCESTNLYVYFPFD